MADESQAKGVARAEADGRRRRGDRARSAILGRAIQIASTEGIEGLTLGRLAADLGIGKANISVLFGDKETLKLKTLDAAVDVFIETVVRPHATIGSPLGRLRAWCGAWFDYVEARVLPGGCMLHAASSEYRARPGVMQDRVRQHRDAWRRLLTGAAREALAAGELRQADAEQLVFELLAFEAAANSALLLGETEAFRRARLASMVRLPEEPAFLADVTGGRS